MRDLLTKIEWSYSRRFGLSPERRLPACPSCFGIKPTHWHLYENSPCPLNNGFCGHEKECQLAGALAWHYTPCERSVAHTFEGNAVEIVHFKKTRVLRFNEPVPADWDYDNPDSWHPRTGIAKRTDEEADIEVEGATLVWFWIFIIFCLGLIIGMCVIGLNR